MFVLWPVSEKFERIGIDELINACVCLFQFELRFPKHQLFFLSVAVWNLDSDENIISVFSHFALYVDYFSIKMFL